MSFIKLEIKFECSYYLEARRKNQDFISNLITWNLSDKSIITYKKTHDLLKVKLKTNIFYEHQLMQTWCSINKMFLVLCVLPLRKSELWIFFSTKFPVKVYRYVPYEYRVVLDFVSFWDGESSKGQSEAHFLKKFAFVSNKCWAQDAFGKCSRTTENLSKYTVVHE